LLSNHFDKQINIQTDGNQMIEMKSHANVADEIQTTRLRAEFELEKLNQTV